MAGTRGQKRVGTALSRSKAAEASGYPSGLRQKFSRPSRMAARYSRIVAGSHLPSAPLNKSTRSPGEGCSPSRPRFPAIRESALMPRIGSVRLRRPRLMSPVHSAFPHVTASASNGAR